jgi:hypothetical protein
MGCYYTAKLASRQFLYMICYDNANLNEDAGWEIAEIKSNDQALATLKCSAVGKEGAQKIFKKN